MDNIGISHLLFVDDLMLFAKVSDLFLPKCCPWVKRNNLWEAGHPCH